MVEPACYECLRHSWLPEVESSGTSISERKTPNSPKSTYQIILKPAAFPMWTVAGTGFTVALWSMFMMDWHARRAASSGSGCRCRDPLFGGRPSRHPRASEMKKMIILRSKLRALMPIMSYLGVLRLSRAQWELVAS